MLSKCNCCTNKQSYKHINAIVYKNSFYLLYVKVRSHIFLNSYIRYVLMCVLLYFSNHSIFHFPVDFSKLWPSVSNELCGPNQQPVSHLRR